MYYKVAAECAAGETDFIGVNEVIFKDQVTGYFTSIYGDFLCLLINGKVGIEVRDGQRFFKYDEQVSRVNSFQGASVNG
jgi:hypothetical protein